MEGTPQTHRSQDRGDRGELSLFMKSTGNRHRSPRPKILIGGGSESCQPDIVAPAPVSRATLMS